MSLRRPQPMEATVTVNYATADKQVDATFNWDTRSRRSKVQVAAGFKDAVNYRSVDREARFKIMLPTREVGMNVGYTTSASQFTHKADLHWDRSASTRFGYDVAMTRGSRRGEDIIDGSINVRSAIVNIETAISHRAAPGRMYVTEMGVEMEQQKLTIKNELVFTDPSFKNTLTLKHPMFSRVSWCFTLFLLQTYAIEGNGFHMIVYVCVYVCVHRSRSALRVHHHTPSPDLANLTMSA